MPAPASAFRPLDRKTNELDLVLVDGCAARRGRAANEVPGLFVVPATSIWPGPRSSSLSDPRREFRLNAMSGVRRRLGLVLIDCPPSLGLLTLNALAAAPVLVPLQCEFFALEGLSHLLRTIERSASRLTRRCVIHGVVLTMFDRRNNLSEQVAADVRALLGEKVFRTVIPRNVRVSEAPSHGKPVLLYDCALLGSQAYTHLAGEMLRRESGIAAVA